MATIYDNLSIEDLTIKLNETSEDHPDYSLIKAALAKKQAEGSYASYDDETAKALSYAVDEGIPGTTNWQKFLSTITRQPYRAATESAYGYTPTQLNQMNALGGYYSEPARAQRRWEKRQTNVLNRAAAGKPVGNVDLLLGQHGYTSDGDGGISFTGTPQCDPTAGADYSRTADDGWSYSPFKQGGRVRYAEGGIVNLLPKGAW